MNSYVLRRRGVGEKIQGVIEESSQTGLTVVRNDKPIPENASYCFRWGTTSTIPNSGSTISVNTPQAIHEVYDKRTFRKKMSDAGAAMATWTDFGDFLDQEWGGYKVIVRPEHHIRSLDMNVCETLSEVYKATKKYEKYYISEYIKKDKEYRVFMMSGRIWAIVEKIPQDPNEVSWGCVDEGVFRYVPWNEWPLELTRKAVQAFSLSSLDFGALDIISAPTGLSGPNRGYWCLEINTAPELTPYYLKTLTKCFDYVVENGNGKIPVVETNDFKGYIHPALTNLATLQPENII